MVELLSSTFLMVKPMGLDCPALAALHLPNCESGMNSALSLEDVARGEKKPVTE